MRRVNTLLIAIVATALAFYLSSRRAPDETIKVEPGDTVRISPGQVVRRRGPSTPRREQPGPVAGPLPGVREETHETYVPPEGRTEVTRTDDGEVEVRTWTWGPTFRPGFQWAFKEKLGLDAKVFFYNRWGLNLGSVFDVPSRRIDLSCSVSYHLGRSWFSNLEAFGGVLVADRQPYVGLRINF